MALDKYAKALVAFLTAAYAVYSVATGVESAAGSGVTVGEWIGIVVAGVTAGVAVWAVPNKPVDQ